MRQSVADTFRNRDEGGAVTGFSRAISLIDRPALTAALDWLGISSDTMSSSEIGPTTWREHLLPGASGKAAGCLENAVIALHDSTWECVFRWNESALRVDVCGPLPWEPSLSAPRQLADHDVTGVTAWMQREGIKVRRDDAAHAIDAISRRKSFHPIRDYFTSLRWDANERLNRWTVDYLGTEDTPYARAVGERFLIGAVARVMRPGSKVDTCLVLEGDQGIGKSSALRALGEPWFSDQLHDVGSKDAVLQMRGQLIVELAELDALSRAEASKVKQFLSSQVDNVRLPYARYTTSAPRECVFAGSVNPVDHIGYLRDETGNRRFWPLTCAVVNPIDLAGLVRDKDQLWAEAVVRFNAGAAWWLHEAELVFDAAKRTAKRLVSDPWNSKISAFVGGRECVTITDVLTDCLLKPAERWTPSDKQRVGRSLRKMGWGCRRVGGRDDRELAWFAPKAA